MQYVDTGGAVTNNPTRPIDVSNVAHVQNKWLADGSVNIDGNQSLAFEPGQGGPDKDLDLTFRRDELYKIQFTGSVDNKSVLVTRAVDPMIGGVRIAETNDITTSPTWSEVPNAPTNKVVDLMKKYIGISPGEYNDDLLNSLSTTDPTLAREYRDVFHMGFFKRVTITANVNDIGGGGLTSSMDISYINKVIANRITSPTAWLREGAVFDLNDYSAAGGGIL